MKTILARVLLSGLLLASLTQGGFAFEMVKIPAGELYPFWLAPQKRTADATPGAFPTIKIKAFEMMSTAVTEAQYLAFLAVRKEFRKKNASQLYVDGSYLQDIKLGAHKNSPVVQVSWFAAQAFCKQYGMRLPTVNEWEYVATASEKERYAEKEEKFLQRILDWYGEPRVSALKPVKSIYKNVYGVWDMHGLVWEWVYDFNSVFVTGESREDQSFNKDLFCGAGANSGADKENYAAFMRFAFRSSLKGKNSAWNLGFRCVR